MEFAVICPEDLLEHFGRRTKYHLVLAQHCDRRKYFQFYYDRARRGDVVLLDNGAYEGSLVAPERLLELTKDLEPTVVVLPDSPGNFITTKEMSLKFLEMLYKYGVKVEKMMVLHGPPGSLPIFEMAYVQACKYADWIGFTRRTMRFGVPGESYINRRAWFAKHLQNEKIWDHSKKHHALGMIGGSVPELHRLASVGFTGCDSSSPVWRGINGYRYGDPWPDIPFSLAGPIYPDIDKAEANLQEVLEACRG
jgi:hypothetical protein